MLAQAAVATAPTTPLILTHVDVDDPAPGELQVRMVASGVCHTDAIVRDQWYPTPLPAVLGHEGAGVVQALGDGVTEFSVGDRVLLSFSHCGRCSRCTQGEPAYCASFFERNFGGHRDDGTTAFMLEGEPVSSHFFGQSSFCALSNVPVECAIAVPEDAPLEVLAPLGCGIQTGAGAILNVLRPLPGGTIAVFGAGAVGLAAVMAARASECATIIAVDLHPERLDLARDLGATHTVCPREVDVVEAVTAAAPQGVGHALETTGVPEVFTAMTRCLAVRGVAGVVGAASLGTSASFDIGSSLPLGITIRMIVEGDSVPRQFVPQLIELQRRGEFPFERLIRTYPFEQINDAFADSACGTTLKPVVVFGQ